MVILGSCLTILCWYSMQHMVGLCPRDHQNVTAALVTLVGRVHLCPAGRTDPLVFIALFGMIDDRPLPKTLHWSRVVLFDKGNQKHPGHNVPQRPGRWRYPRRAERRTTDLFEPLLGHVRRGNGWLKKIYGLVSVRTSLQNIELEEIPYCLETHSSTTKNSNIGNCTIVIKFRVNKSHQYHITYYNIL